MIERDQSPPAPKISLRREARSYAKHSLTASQRYVFDKVVWLLQDALTQLDLSQQDAEEAAKFPPRLEPQTRRVNPVIMVSGRRGTGKTSLLLTLQREVSLAPAVTSANSGDPLSELGRRIVWLETLDLEPLPQGTGLMAAIMARIEQAVSEDSDKDDLALRRPQTNFGVTMQQLNDLSLDVCLAWDPDYPRQGGSNDTDLYARELMRVESARTSLQTRFANLLDELAATTPWKSQRQKPLFVLPVDDIDLNPAHCLELLRLVRSFRTPRFVVLLFGDYEIARSVVNLSFLKELGGLLPGDDVGTDTVRESVGALALRLGAEAMRKMLPPNQRLPIKSVSVEEALGFPLKEKGVESIGALLGKITVPYKLDESRARVSLADWVAGGSGSPWPDGSEPTAGLAFTTSLRKLVDLWIRLEELTSTNTDDKKRLRELIATLWVEFQRGLVEDGVVIGPDAQAEFEYTPDAALPYAPFRLDFARAPELERQIPSLRSSQLVLRFPAQPQLEAPKPEMTTGPLTPQTLGRAVLLHDLMTLTDARAFKPLVIPHVKALGLVSIYWQVEVGGTPCTVAWRAPTLRTCWELELFLAHWNRHRSRLSDSMGPPVFREELMPVTTFWLALCGAFAFESKKLWDIVERSLTDAGDILTDVVTEYASQVAMPNPPARRPGKRKPAPVAAQPPSAPPRAADWLLRTAAFLSPESYIDPSVAEAFHANRDLNAYWSLPRTKQVVQDHRKQSITNPNSLIAHALLSPAKYPDAVAVLLERAMDIAGDLTERVSAETFRLRYEPANQVNDLVAALTEAAAALTPERRASDDPTPKRMRPPRRSPGSLLGDAFSKQLALARNSLDQLRRAANTRTAAGTAVRSDVESIENQVLTIEHTLTEWGESAQHPANTFNGGEFCPDLPRDEVTA